MRIRSLDDVRNRCKIIPWTGCWIWQRSTFDSGYGQASIGDKNWRAHRLSWTLAKGPIPDGAHVLHRCDTPKCVNPEHLWLGTNADNTEDREAKGRNGAFRYRGSNHYLAKITEDDVRRIRNGEFGHLLNREIAAHFGVSEGLVAQIKRGVIWRHVE